MELDVHLTREGEEPWGFEIIEDIGIPLTIDKVYPSSPAAAAGLQPGDLITRIGDKLTTELTLDAALDIIGEAIGSLSLGLTRGLYEPVLDEYEPIYEPIEPVDFDRQSATEVYLSDYDARTSISPNFDNTNQNKNNISRSQTPYDYSAQLLSTSQTPQGLSAALLSNSQTPYDPSVALLSASQDFSAPFDSRSVTASPFACDKVYRPFSTEPLEVPPLEDPIILNPDYNDDFSFIDEVTGEEIVKTKFKLPISEQYDPNYSKKVAEILDNIGKKKVRKTNLKSNVQSKFVEKETSTINSSKEETTFFEKKTIKNEQTSINGKSENDSTTVDVIKTDAKSKGIHEKVQIIEKTEIDIEKIEQTAVEIVEENIERAVSVTEEIKKEIEEELRASVTKELESSAEVTKTQTTSVKEELTSAKEERVQRSEIQSEKSESYKKSEDQEVITEDISKTVLVNETSLNDSHTEEINESEVVEIKNTNCVKKDFVEHEKSTKEDIKQSSNEFKERIEVNYTESVSEKEGKQMAYNIGLQTIPNIRGMIQSSHHFDLLLRTFFIHLTDVMVALSRFILTQPITELNKKTEKVINEKLITGFNEVSKSSETKREMKKEESVLKRDTALEKRETVQNKKVTERKQAVEVKRQGTQNQEVAVKDEMIESQIEKKKLTGAKIAQKQQMKSKELTQKMDAVINEFETKSGIEDTIDRRRSRSRSRIEEEVMSESDPLEWLDKVNRSSQERIEVSSSKTATLETKEVKTKHRSTTPSKQMYIATVESHVYTNKDAILEEQLSETSSVQSSEEVNTALEVIDTFKENTAVKTSFETAEKQQAVEVITNALEDIVQEKQKTLESVTEFDSMKAESVHETVIKDTQVIATAESIQSSTELKYGELDIQQTKLQQAVISSEKSLKTAVKNTDISLESTKEFIEERKTNTQQATVKKEFLSTAASESIETSTESNVQVLESKSIKENVASVISANDFKAVAVETIEIPLEATAEVKKQKTDIKEAVTMQELLSNIASESTEVVNLESTGKTEVFEAATKTASVTSENNYKSIVLQSETLVEESNAQIKDVKTKEQTASTKIEPLSIATAETTNILMNDKLETFETKTLESKKASVKMEESYKAVAVESTEVSFEAAEEEHKISLEKEALIKEDTRHLSVAGIIETKTETDKIKTQTYDEDHAALKIIKEEVTTIDNSIEINESELNVHKSLQITDIESHKEISNHESKSKLRLQTKITVNGDLIDTPTPSTVPPTPLTDEYVFKLTIPLPKSRGTTPIPEEIDHEDPHIVKKKLIPHIETKIEDQIIYNPPLPTPPGDKSEPVYTKPGLRGGGCIPCNRKEYIREIERKSSLLASAIDETIKSIEVYKEEVGIDKQEPIEEKVEEEKVEDEENNVDISEELVGYRPVAFNPEAGKDKRNVQVTFQVNVEEGRQSKLYTDASGETLGTVQGIVDGLEEATVDQNIAKELGKPGLTEEKIAELISGESEMLREAHVMGLSRVISSHMHRPDDSVDFKKIKPLVDSLRDSEVLKALNEELLKTQAEMKKKDEKKWTTFLQKPKRPVPKPKFGYHGYVEQENFDTQEPYKVKIVKQPKPKVAPDYKPEDFETGPLPWEERALNETPPPPIEAEEPILIPEGTPEFLEAVDPLPESEVPDLEDTGIPLPPPRQLVTPEAPTEEVDQQPSEPEEPEEATEDIPQENPAEDTSMADKRENNANSLIESIKNMVDPSAPIEQQLNQMRAQLAALAQLPCVIQQSLEMLTRQLMMVGQQESKQVQQCKMESQSIKEETIERCEENESTEELRENHDVCIEEMLPPIEEDKEENSPQPCEEEKVIQVKNEEEAIVEQDEKQRKLEILHQAIEEQMRLDQESRQLKQRPTPRVGKPKPVFGPLHPEERPLVLPGGRKWRGPKDVMNDQMIAETLQGQAEVIQGKVMGYINLDIALFKSTHTWTARAV